MHGWSPNLKFLGTVPPVLPKSPPVEGRLGISWEERMPERKVERTEGESALQRVGPIEAKDRDVHVFGCGDIWSTVGKMKGSP